MPGTLPHSVGRVPTLPSRDSSPILQMGKLRLSEDILRPQKPRGVRILASSSRVLVEWGKGCASHLFRGYFGPCSVCV